MAKRELFGNDAQKKLLSGVQKLSKTVGCTLGPQGKTVATHTSEGIRTTKDGVTAAHWTKMEDPTESIGATLIKSAAARTADIAGDGTSTATILAAAIYEKSLQTLSSGGNILHIREGIKEAGKKALSILEGIRKYPVDTANLHKVAYISSNGDEELSEVVADTISKVGPEGIVYVDPNVRPSKSYARHITGLELEDRGLLHPQFANNSRGTECEFNDAKVLVSKVAVSSAEDARAILTKIPVAKKGEKTGLLLIAPNFDEAAIETFIVNNDRRPSLLVKMPGSIDQAKDVSEDIAVAVGGKALGSSYSESVHALLQDCLLEDYLGSCGKVKSDRRSTIIYDAKGGEGYEKRIQYLKDSLKEDSQTAFEKERYQTRLSRLTSNVATIYVSAFEETEHRERVDRFDDSISAVRSAQKSGILPGAGSSLLIVREVLKRASDVQNDPKSQGFRVFSQALDMPAKTLFKNAGFDPEAALEQTRTINDEHIEKVINGNIPEDISELITGYNARKGEWVKLVEDGIIDPFLVTKSAIESAVSVAITLLSIECVLEDVEFAGQSEKALLRSKLSSNLRTLK